jgi:hypothetical protein
MDQFATEAAIYTKYSEHMSRHIRNFSEIQTRGTNYQAASNPSFKRHGYWDHLLSLLQGIKVFRIEKEEEI